MLVLSRQLDETIVIGEDIQVTVVGIRGDKVRLCVTAPKEIAVHRKEVHDRIRRENRDAARVVACVAHGKGAADGRDGESGAALGAAAAPAVDAGR